MIAIDPYIYRKPNLSCSYSGSFHRHPLGQSEGSIYYETRQTSIIHKEASNSLFQLVYFWILRFAQDDDGGSYHGCNSTPQDNGKLINKTAQKEAGGSLFQLVYFWYYKTQQNLAHFHPRHPEQSEGSIYYETRQTSIIHKEASDSLFQLVYSWILRFAQDDDGGNYHGCNSTPQDNGKLINKTAQKEAGGSLFQLVYSWILRFAQDDDGGSYHGCNSTPQDNGKLINKTAQKEVSASLSQLVYSWYYKTQQNLAHFHPHHPEQSEGSIYYETRQTSIIHKKASASLSQLVYSWILRFAQDDDGGSYHGCKSTPQDNGKLINKTAQKEASASLFQLVYSWILRFAQDDDGGSYHGCNSTPQDNGKLINKTAWRVNAPYC